MSHPESNPDAPLTLDEFLGGLAAGIDDVLVKAMGPGKCQFTILLHGSVGLSTLSNAKREDSLAAMKAILQQWEAEDAASSSVVE